MDGCTLYTNLAQAVTLTNIGGATVWNIFVPPRADLLGKRFCQQILVSDPNANPFGAVVSNAGAGVIGGR